MFGSSERDGAGVVRGQWWAALNSLGLACCVVIAVSYGLSQLTYVRRWLTGDRSPGNSFLISVSLGVISLTGEFLVPTFSMITRYVRYIAPVVGGMYGGPTVGVGSSIFIALGRVVIHGSWPGVDDLTPTVVGLVAGVLGSHFAFRFSWLTTIAVAAVALAFDTMLDHWLLGGAMTWEKLLFVLANLVTILIVARLFANEEAEEEHKRLLEQLALTDGLTHLANHRHFHTQLAKEIETARIRGSTVALVMMDIDYFKSYNDAFGHPEGDRLLTAIGDAIRLIIRSGDTGARYGGDEFALILPNANLESAQAVARRVQEALNRHVRTEGQGAKLKSNVSLSAGVAVYPDSATDKDDLIKRADEALYAAKYSENRLEVYHSVFDDLKEQLDSSELSLINTVKTLLTVINAKDRYTYGHSERVVNHCLMVARQLELGEEQVKLLRIAAFLHDIGKIEIARDILNKADRLSPAETRIIEQHPVWGADIIQPVRSLRQVVPVVLHHHERYDGTGYPGHLKADQIPLLARILSVADAFDAMTTERPYQPAKDIPEALAELKRCAGAQFDPWVVDAFAAALLELPDQQRAAAAR